MTAHLPRWAVDLRPPEVDRPEPEANLRRCISDLPRQEVDLPFAEVTPNWCRTVYRAGLRRLPMLEGLPSRRYAAAMQLSELLPALHQLPRADKFRVVQFLTTELAQDESGLQPGAEYPIWSPFEAHDATATLSAYLREQTGNK